MSSTATPIDGTNRATARQHSETTAAGRIVATVSRSLIACSPETVSATTDTATARASAMGRVPASASPSTTSTAAASAAPTAAIEANTGRWP